MTIVAAFKIKNIPVLVGDLLLSGKGKQSILDLPTVDDIFQFQLYPNSSKTVVGLTQKVNIINKNILIGWAGSYLGAKIILSDLKKISETETFTKESLENFFINRKSWVGDEQLAFIGYRSFITLPRGKTNNPCYTRLSAKKKMILGIMLENKAPNLVPVFYLKIS